MNCCRKHKQRTVSGPPVLFDGWDWCLVSAFLWPYIFRDISCPHCDARVTGTRNSSSHISGWSNLNTVHRLSSNTIVGWSMKMHHRLQSFSDDNEVMLLYFAFSFEFCTSCTQMSHCQEPGPSSKAVQLVPGSGEQEREISREIIILCVSTAGVLTRVKLGLSGLPPPSPSSKVVGSFKAKAL